MDIHNFGCIHVNDMDMNYGAIKKIDEIEIELETGTRERASVVIEKMKES